MNKENNKGNASTNDETSSSSSSSSSGSSSGSSPINDESKRIYPERRGEWQQKWSDKVFGRKNISQIKCENKVKKIAEKSPLVKLMMSALKSVGCEFDLSRHVCCEVCTYEVNGGYDPELNQIVICHNQAFTESTIRGIMTHEMIHMFDYCRAKFDFNNLEHVACSEIRAANLTHCSYLSAVINGSASPINIAKAHRNCVKAKAMASIMTVQKDLSRDDVWAVIDRVFVRCYNDLEPIGRRIRRSSNHMEWAYRERFHYNYD